MFLRLGRRRQNNGSFSGEQKEGERLLQVETHDAVGVAQVANRDVLADVQTKIASARGEHEGAGDGWGPNDYVLDELFDVLQHRVPIVTGLGESRIGIGTEQDGIRSIDADETQLVQGLRNRVRILAHVGRQGHGWVAGALPDATDACRGIALEDGTVLSVGDLLGSVFRRLPVGVVRTAFHVVDLLAIEFEWDAKLDQRLDLALARENAIARRGDRLEV